MEFDDIIFLVGRSVEAFGVAVIVIGAAWTTGIFVRNAFTQREGAYNTYRQGLGKTILLGLELLVAGDIISTVVIAPNFTNVGVLAAIVLIRTFLSWSIDVELEGRWPWQRAAKVRA